MAKSSSGVTTKISDIKRWQENGLYSLADEAIRRCLQSTKHCLEMTKWIYEQKNGKAAQGVELSGDIGFSITDLAKKALEINRDNVSHT